MKFMQRHFDLCRVSCFLIVAVVALGGCEAPRGYPNSGSCFGAVTGGMRAVRSYLEEHGSLPFFEGDPMQALRNAGLDGEELEMLQYINDRRITAASPKETIILLCPRPIAGSEDRRYIALLSGDILVVPSRFAVLGRLLPSGVGNVVDHR